MTFFLLLLCYDYLLQNMFFFCYDLLPYFKHISILFISLPQNHSMLVTLTQFPVAQRAWCKIVSASNEHKRLSEHNNQLQSHPASLSFVFIIITVTWTLIIWLLSFDTATTTIFCINMITGISISNLKDVLDDEWVDVLGDLVEQQEVSKSLKATIYG